MNYLKLELQPFYIDGWKTVIKHLIDLYELFGKGYSNLDSNSWKNKHNVNYCFITQEFDEYIKYQLNKNWYYRYWSFNESRVYFEKENDLVLAKLILL
jgi:hypothetical protein